MQVVILAAGRGTRLRTLTEARSKAMMPVIGTPMIGWALRTFLEIGIQSFVVVIRPGDRDLRAYLDSQNVGSVKVQIAEQAEPLGMGHALACAVSWLGSRFLVAACDSVFSEDTIDRFVRTWDHRRDLEVLLAVEAAGSQDLSQRSVVMMDGRKVRQIIEKPGPQEIKSKVTSLPLYGFSRRILPEIRRLELSPRGEFELQPAIQRLIARYADVEGMFVERRWNLTTTDDLLAMNLEALRDMETTPEKAALEKKWGVSIQPPVRIEAGVVLGPNVSLGPEVYLESGCEIGEGVKISRSVVLRQARVSPGCRIEGEILG